MQTVELETIASHAADFRPRRYLRNGHLQTIAGNYLSRVDDLPAPEEQLVEVSPATTNQIASLVLCHCHWQPEAVRAERPTAIIVHGLEGSSNSQYVVGNSNKLWHAGCNVVRMNMRNCGGTEALTPTLYHSGLSSDVLTVMNFFVAQYGLQSISLIGY
jgi:predicted alpha/beta-fold hydrolase